jgi:lysyl-tRNA synthetase class 2
VSFKHNPEFTMLETYEAFADYEDVMRMTDEMVAFAAQAALGTTVVEWKGQTIDLAPPWRRLSLGAALAEHVGFDPLDPAVADREAGVRAALAADGVDTAQDRTWAQLVDHALSHFIEPGLVAPTFLVDYPVELSPLSRQMPDRPHLTERFEAFCGGMEIANGYSELNDPDEQHARFEEQAQMGRAGDEAAHPIDHDYVNALAYGMPPTGGLGVGIDRVVMLLTGATSIREVVLFPAMRDRSGG